MDEPQIRGDGVLLRTPRLADADQIAAACVDPEIQRFIAAMPSPYTRDDAVRWIEQTRAGAPDRMGLVITDPATDLVLGGTGLHHLSWDEGTGEVGYWVAPWARRRGVAIASTVALTGWGFRRGLARIELLTHPANWASQRVALRSGYRREGPRRAAVAARGGLRDDVVVWARLAADPAGPTPRLLPDLPGGWLTDGVVALRPTSVADAADVFALRSLPEVVASTVPPQPPDAATTTRRCAEAPGAWLAGERAEVTIRDAASGAFAGHLGLHYQEPATGQALIGYAVLPAWRGRGFASRAAALVAGWAFESVGVARVIAGIAPDNVASQRVVERIGFRREGYQRARLPGPAGTRIDDLLYALLPGELVSPTRTPPPR